MKSFFRQGAPLLAIGGTIISAFMAIGSQVSALTQQEIVQELQNIPVFTITDTDENPIVTVLSEINDETSEADAKVTILTDVYINPRDAQDYLTNEITSASPEIGQSAQVTPVPLAFIYATDLTFQSEEHNLEFVFIPSSDEVSYALSLLPEDAAIRGVPLFRVWAEKSGSEGESNLEVMTITLPNGEEPLFFSRDQIDDAIDSLGNASDFRDNAQVEVLWLGDYIRHLREAENSEYQLVPLDASVNFVETFTSGF